MAVTYTKTGTAEAADIEIFRIKRDDAGVLTAEVTFKATINGEEQSKTTSWPLSAQEKSDIQTYLLPGVLAAIDAAS